MIWTSNKKLYYRAYEAIIAWNWEIYYWDDKKHKDVVVKIGLGGFYDKQNAQQDCELFQEHNNVNAELVEEVV